MINIISGGLHASKNLDFQDFLIVAIGAERYSQALDMSLAVYRATQELLAERGLSTLKADEGGFGPALPNNRAALDLLMQAVERAGYRPGEEIAFAIDVAASHFYQEADKSYHLDSENKVYDAAGMIGLLADWGAQCPIISLCDGFDENRLVGRQAVNEPPRRQKGP